MDKAHYENHIKSNAEWEFAGLYYDEGISGTKKEKRDGLLAMIVACERGTIDLSLPNPSAVLPEIPRTVWNWCGSCWTYISTSILKKKI